jgi:hypothetical protein
MKYAKIVNGIVVQTQPNEQAGFIEVADDVVCTQIQEGNSFVNPPPTPIHYTQLRAAAYPSLSEQADMAYWDRQNGTTTLDDAINAVKLKYPKTGA